MSHVSTHGASDAPSFEGRTALVVDDDPDLLLQLQVGLEAIGFRVVAAHGEAETESLLPDLLAGRRPDVAILDLMMEHDDSGFILAWRLKRTFPGLPVLLVTAVSHRTGMDFDAATRDERSWVRADAVLTKPVRFDQVRRELSRLLGPA